MKYYNKKAVRVGVWEEKEVETNPIHLAPFAYFYFLIISFHKFVTKFYEELGIFW